MVTKTLKFLYEIYIYLIILLPFYICCSCSNGGTDSSINNVSKPLNLCIFVDLSDRIEKEKDNMNQADKDQMIIKGLVNSFISKQVKEGFQKSEDSFQIVFYPAPDGAHEIADNLSLNLKNIEGPKKGSILDFKNNYAKNLEKLYSRARNEHNYFGSDIWGFFKKDKVADLCKPGYRNVLIILSDGYIFDDNNKIVDGKYFSFILPKTLAIKDSGLIPCKISNSDIEIYFMECNPIPQTDYEKMKSVLEDWFKQMGISKVDIQDTDIPQNTLNHLLKNIF